MVKRAYIIRHGHCEGDDLSRHGLEQLKRVQKQIKKEGDLSEAIIISSNSPKAQKSVDIINKEFGLLHMYDNCLWSNGDSRPANPIQAAKSTVEYANHNHADTVIIVTHLEYTSTLPNALSQLLNNTNIDTMPQELAEGEMYILDFEKNTMDVLEAPRVM